MLRRFGFLVALAGLVAVSAPAAAQQCVPDCREGFACVGGVCQPACNPPCPAGESCVDGRYCEPPPAYCNPPCAAGEECLEGRYCEPVEAYCNPPCPAGEECIDGRYCEPAPALCSPPCREGYYCDGGRCLQDGAPPTPGQPATPGPATPGQPATPGPATPGPPTGGTTPQPPSDTAPPADTGPEGPRPTYVKLRFGFGGSITLEALGDSVADDLTATIGAAVGHDWLLRTGDIGISAGVMLSGLWWNTATASDNNVGRNTLIEINLVPKVSYRLQPGLFLYGGLPLGVSISVLNDEGIAAGSTDVGFGWNLSVLVGAQYTLEAFGVFAELGVDVHTFSNTVTTTLVGDSLNLDFSFTQFALNLGVAF